jgi:hypothetical protein
MVGGPRKEAKLNDVRDLSTSSGSPNQEVIHVDVAAIKRMKSLTFYFSHMT